MNYNREKRKRFNQNYNDYPRRPKIVRNVGHFRGNSSHTHQSSSDCIPEKSPLDIKIDTLVTAVQSQKGFRGKLVLMENEADGPASVTLQNSLNSINSKLTVDMDYVRKKYILKIDDEEITQCESDNKQNAKTILTQQALDILKQNCFFILKNKNYDLVSNDELRNKKFDETEKNPALEGSKAHQMMLKMGWGGKGLGANEQGSETAVGVYQNVTRQGLGSDNVINEINRILEDYARSPNMTVLAFDPEFTKEERALIHKIAAKFHLKSKSEGKESRRITVSKKLEKFNMVRELLRIGGKNKTFTLTIPIKFQQLWTND